MITQSMVKLYLIGIPFAIFVTGVAHAVDCRIEGKDMWNFDDDRYFMMFAISFLWPIVVPVLIFLGIFVLICRFGIWVGGKLVKEEKEPERW